MSDLIDILRRMRESAVPSKPSGAVGQMLGCESYRITMTGNSLSHLEELAEAQAKRIAELESDLHFMTVGRDTNLEYRNYAQRRIVELEADNARLRVDGWFPANLANVPTGDMRRKVLSYWSSGTVEGKYTAEELAYHIAAHAKHGDHFVVAKAWAEYPTAAIDAAKESA